MLPHAPLLPPLVWIAAATASGIALHAHWPAPWGPSAGVLAVLVAVWAGLLRRGWEHLGAVLALGACAALGFVHAAAADARQPSWPAAADGRRVEIRGAIRAGPEPGPHGWWAVVRVRGLRVAGAVPRGRRTGMPPWEAPLGPVEAAAGLVRATGRGPTPAVRPGDEVLLRGRFRLGRPAGNPGERAERDALRRRGLAGVIALDRDRGLEVIGRAGWSPRAAVGAARRRIVEVTRRAQPDPHAALVLSLLLGIDAFLPPELYQRFTQAGLVHLMVVSGAQVAIVAGVLAALAGALRLHPWVRAGLVGTGIGTFAALVGWAPSVGRAVLMTGLALMAATVGRQRDPATSLAAAALGLLAANPAVLFDVGFQLSFAAPWGLLYLAPVLAATVGAVPAWAARAAPPAQGVAAPAATGGRVIGARRILAAVVAGLAASLGAQIAVAPLLALHFQSLPAAGLVANALALPIVASLVPVGFALLAVVLLLPDLGGALLGLLRPATAALVWIAERTGGLPWAVVTTPPVSAPVAAVAYLALGAAVAAGRGTWRPARSVRTGAAAVLVGASAIWLSAAVRPPSVLLVTVLDVGQGDAILIQSPSGRVALIDAGGDLDAAATGRDVGRRRVLPALRRAGVRRLDVAALSHPHEDHVGGLPAVVENFPVGVVLDPGVPHPSPAYLRLLGAIQGGRIPHRIAREGMEVDLGAGVRLSVLYPPDVPPAVDDDPVHARGLVARVQYGAFAALLTGDVEDGVEEYLLGRGVVLESVVLKVGHHGSRTSTSAAFVAAVRPRVAVLSVGADNVHGHPHPAVLDALWRAGARIYRTDRHGAVRIESDGVVLRVRPHRGEPAPGPDAVRLP
ncbi:MAG: DNA internalization-related competence protein ComEC/Rec2 [Armatimonadota bacterium]|nr:DNA internalization-related competence protein ComEC/Rec2 [Armatimonadota bacterium]